MVALVWALSSGFEWPRAEGSVSALTTAETPRETQDALRRLAEPDARPPWSEVDALLDARDPATRAAAVEVMARRGFDGAQLDRLLADDSADVRAAALLGLVPGTFSERVLRVLGDTDPAVRAAAVAALSPASSQQVLAALLGALDDQAVPVRLAAIAGLAQRGEPAALDALLRSFSSALPELRAALLDALTPATGARVEALFARALADEDEQVVLAALRGYARAGLPLPLRSTTLAQSASPAVAYAAGRILMRSEARDGSPAPWLAPLERTAWSSSAHTSELLLGELERVIPPGEQLATDPLLEWLSRTPSSLHGRIAALALRSGGPVRREALAPLLTSRDPAARAAGLALLARAPDALRSPALWRALDDPDPEARSAAEQTMEKRLDPQGARRLLERIDDADGQSRTRLVGVLAHGLDRLAGTLAFQDAGEGLCDVLERDATAAGRAASLAMRALAHVEHACARVLVRAALTDARPGIRIAALRASTRDRHDDAIALRARLAQDGDVRVAATALVARVLAGDSMAEAPTDHRRLYWPLGPIWAFVHATRNEHSASACAWLASAEPVTRANAVAALVHRRAPAACDALVPALLTRSSAWPIRHAAAALLPASDALVRARTTCLVHEPDARVRARCAGDANEVIHPAQTVTPRALVLHDGRVLISFPDGADEVAWPALPTIASVSPWIDDYGKE
jgi:HEAT repeat protein